MTTKANETHISTDPETADEQLRELTDLIASRLDLLHDEAAQAHVSPAAVRYGGPAHVVHVTNLPHLLIEKLRRAADAIDPEGGMIPCPLCLASPRFLRGDIESHLITVHAALAGAAQ